MIPAPLTPLPETPLVSILVTSFNYEAYIQEALQSAMKQSYRNLEIIVCDDGSTDESCAIVSSLAAVDDRIRLLQQGNAGVAAALNHAFHASSGAIICLLDADDTFQGEKVQQVVDKMQSAPKVGFAQHAMEVVDERGAVIRRLPSHGLYEEGWIAEQVIRRGGRWRNMPASALSFRREVAKVLFPLPAAHLTSMADAYLYMLAPLLTSVGYLKEPLSSYRLHGANLTGALHFDAQVSQKYTTGIQRVHQSIQTVIEKRGLDVPTFETDRHLTYLEHIFMLNLFADEPRGRLWKKYRALSKYIQEDDLYPYTRKVLGRLVFGIATFLPGSWRPGWVTTGFGFKV